jgi:hypothetical protein
MAGLTLLALLLLGTGVALGTGPDAPPAGILADPVAAPGTAAPPADFGLPTGARSQAAGPPAGGRSQAAGSPAGARSRAAGSPAGAGPTAAARPTAAADALGRPDGPGAPAAAPQEPAAGPAAPSPDGPPAPVPAPATPTSRPPVRPSAQVAAPFTVSAAARVRCGRGSYTLVVTAEGSAALAGARLRWSVPGATSGTRAMTVDGRTARVTLGDRREPALTWSVRGTATDGRTAVTPTYTVTGRCPAPAG